MISIGTFIVSSLESQNRKKKNTHFSYVNQKYCNLSNIQVCGDCVHRVSQSTGHQIKQGQHWRS